MVVYVAPPTNVDVPSFQPPKVKPVRDVPIAATVKVSPM